MMSHVRRNVMNRNEMSRNVMSRLAGVSLACVVASACWAQAGGGVQGSQAFSEAGLGGLRDVPPDAMNPYAIEARYVGVNTGVLFGEAGERGAAAESSVVFSLFDGVSVEASRVVQDLGVGNTPTWYGRLSDDELGYALLVMTEGGYVSGKILSSTHGLFEVAPAGPGGSVLLTKIDVERMPGCGNKLEHDVGPAGIPQRGGAGPRAAWVAPEADKEGRRGVINEPVAPGELGASQGERGVGFTFVDVLIAYTPAAASSAGGTAQIESQINAAVADSNLAYQQSLSIIRINAVDIVETAYTENADMGIDLSRLQATNDSFMDELHPLRNTLAADLISLIVANATGGACGIGYLMTNVSTTFASSGVSVTSRTCISGYTFHHELGHNMGLAHDRDNAGGASRPYAYGYRTPDNVFRTIMAYAPGTRLNYFSNPNITVSGRVLGNPVNHPTNPAFNAFALDQNAPTIALFRNIFTSVPGAFSILSPANGAVVANRTPQLDWQSSSQAEYYRLEIDNSPSFNSPEVFLEPFTGTSFAVPQGTLQPGVTYSWRVTAFNPLGQTSSNPASPIFSTPPNLPGAFALNAPASGSVGVPALPTLIWTTSVDTDTYAVLVDDDAGFGSPIINQSNLTGTSYSHGGPPLLPLTRYYWKVSATNAIGTAQSSSGAWFFDTIGNQPGPFNLFSPSDGVDVATLRPTLSWGGSANATSYRLIIDNDQNLSSPVLNQSGITGTSLQVPAGVLSNFVRYYWQVRASNQTATTTSSPALFSFATVAPSVCFGDADRNGFVTFGDVTTVLSNFNTSGPQGDANGDGSVNFADITSVLNNFNTICP